jgi:transposase-like protein
MSKFSYEEKVRAAQLVEAGETMANAYRQTGISQQVIRNAFEHIQRYGPESLKQHRYDWSGEEKHTILQHMEMNHMSCAETSIQFGIKASQIPEVWHGS